MAMVMMMMRVLMVMMIGVELIRRGLSREISHCTAPTAASPHKAKLCNGQH